MLGAWPCAQIRPAFSHQFEGQRWSQTVDLGQVDPENAEERGTYIERWCAHLLCLRPDAGQLAGVMVLIGGQGVQHGFKVTITLQHLGLIKVVEVQCVTLLSARFTAT